MRQMGHTTPGFTLSIYAAAMDAGEEERERLRVLVEGTASENGHEMGKSAVSLAREEIGNA